MSRYKSLLLHITAITDNEPPSEAGVQNGLALSCSPDNAATSQGDKPAKGGSQSVPVNGHLGDGSAASQLAESDCGHIGSSSWTAACLSRRDRGGVVKVDASIAGEARTVRISGVCSPCTFASKLAHIIATKAPKLGDPYPVQKWTDLIGEVADLITIDRAQAAVLALRELATQYEEEGKVIADA